MSNNYYIQVNDVPKEIHEFLQPMHSKNSYLHCLGVKITSIYIQNYPYYSSFEIWMLGINSSVGKNDL